MIQRNTAFSVLVAILTGTAISMSGSSLPEWSVPAWSPVDQVRLQGQFAERLERARQRLHCRPLDDNGYVLADISLDRKRIFTEYSGDISGRMIGVEAFLAKRSDTEANRLMELLERAPQFQKPDGHFGAVQKLPTLQRSSDMPILWGNGRLLIGLVEAYEQTTNKTALKLAIKLGQYFLDTDAIYCRKENLQSVGGRHADAFATCYFSCIEGLVGLARVTGEGRYQEQAERIAELALSESVFDNLHSHGRLCAVRGMLDLYELTRESKWLEGAERDWRIVMERYCLPTGGITEMFSRNDGRDEGCAVSDWLRLNLGLWRMTGKGVYLDEAERCLKNHFSYQQFALGGSGHRSFIQVKGEPVGFAGTGVDAYWCCCEHWPRGMVDVQRLALTTAPDGIRANLWVDAEASFANQGWKVQTTETDDGLMVTVREAPKKTAVLHIHRPAWATAGKVETKKSLLVQEAPGEWIVRGDWKRGSTVRVRLPRQIRSEPTANGGQVLFCGHDMLVAHATPANAWLFENKPETRPTLQLNLNGFPDQPYWARTSAQWRSLRLAPLRHYRGEFPHRCWFSFNVTNTPELGKDFAQSRLDRVVFLTVASIVPGRVFLNGREVGQCNGWNTPVQTFASAEKKNSLLVICRSTNELAAAVIAAVYNDSGLISPSKPGWRVRPLTALEAQGSFTEIAENGSWTAAKALDPKLVPSRENRSSPLEDMAPNWSAAPAAGGGVYAFKLDWKQ